MSGGIIDRPSPNHNERPAGAAIDILLLHYTGMPTAAGALDRLCDPAAKVSAHYLIDEDGTAYALVDENRRAWHAGVSYWQGERDINARSIGIELVNPGHEFGYRPFPEPQMRALAGLCHDLQGRHAIPAARVLGHSDVAPTRKADPGELFDWPGLAAEGIGLWPAGELSVPARRTLSPGMAGPAVREWQRALAAFGYEAFGDGRYNAELAFIVKAFQRHWRPAGVDGVADDETQAILYHLLDRAGDAA